MLLIAPSAYGQNWNFINAGKINNYSYTEEAIIHQSVWVDSMQINDSDTLFYLNTIGEYLPIENVIFQP